MRAKIIIPRGRMPRDVVLNYVVRPCCSNVYSFLLSFFSSPNLSGVSSAAEVLDGAWEAHSRHICSSIRHHQEGCAYARNFNPGCDVSYRSLVPFFLPLSSIFVPVGRAQLSLAFGSRSRWVWNVDRACLWLHPA